MPPQTTPARATAPPYRAYATIMGGFVGGLAVAGALAWSLDRDPREQDALANKSNELEQQANPS
jgi:hypothetical protein